MRAEGRIEPESICLGCQQNESKGYRPVYTLHKVAVRRHSSPCHVHEQDQNDETKEPVLGDLWLKSYIYVLLRNNSLMLTIYNTEE